MMFHRQMVVNIFSVQTADLMYFPSHIQQRDVLWIKDLVNDSLTEIKESLYRQGEAGGRNSPRVSRSIPREEAWSPPQELRKYLDKYLESLTR